MFFSGQVYEEIGEIGNNRELRTILIRSSNGEIQVYKEIPRNSSEVFRRIQEKPHPNIVRINALKVVDEELCGVFMEFFPSDTLDDRIIQRGKIPLEETKRIMLQICAAVYHFHKEGIVHRDLKPLNILINQDGIVKISDFGIARIFKKERFSDTEILGTAGYAAPEQFGFYQTDEKTDIFALGVIMNRMLTGKMPVDELYGGDVKVGAIIRRCILMNPAERCELWEIEEALGGNSIHKCHIGKRILKKIPGFRTGNKVHITLAIIDYLYMGFVYLCMFTLTKGKIYLFRWTLGLFISTLGLGWFAGSFLKTAYLTHMDMGIRKAVLFLIYIIMGITIVGIALLVSFM